MRVDSIQVQCDMCGETRTFAPAQGNLWRKELYALVRTDKTHQFGYQTIEIDLCPKCLGKAIRIERIDHEVEYRHPIAEAGFGHEVESSELRWRDVGEGDRK